MLGNIIVSTSTRSQRRHCSPIVHTPPLKGGCTLGILARSPALTTLGTFERKIMIETDAELRGLQNLRWHVAQDGLTHAYSNRSALANDHLFWHGPGTLGVYYSRNTRRAATYARSWWERECGTGTVLPNPQQTQIGDFDGILLFKPRTILDIPNLFFKTIRNPEGRGGFRID